MKSRIYMSVVIGSGLTLLILATIDVTWILGIIALMPGIAIAGVLLPNTASPVPMIIANSVLYSTVVFLFVKEPKRPSRSVAALTVAVAVIVAGGWLASKKWEESGHGMCGNEVVEEAVSPDGKDKAVIFVRSCGATTGFSTHVSVIAAKEKINDADAGNIFSVDGENAVRVDWLSPTTLRVEYPQSDRVFSRKDKYRNIAVNYETQ